MHFKDTDVAQHAPLKNNLRLTLRRAKPRDAEKVLSYVNQVAGESENIGFGPGEFGLSVEEERKFLQQTAESPTSLYVTLRSHEKWRGFFRHCCVVGCWSVCSVATTR